MLPQFELVIVALGCVLAFVHIFAAIGAKTKQYGKQWNMSARDGDMPPLDDVPARLERAQANYLETFPIAVALLLAIVVADRSGTVSAIGSALWLGARIVYLPLYWTGVPKIRTYVFMVSLIGLLMLLGALLAG